MTADYLTLPRLDAAHLSSLYLETASDEAMDAFLKKSKLYDFKKKLWTPIHEVRVAGWEDWSNRDRAFMKVIAGILRRFGNAGRSRKAEGGREGKYDHVWPHRANTGDDRASQLHLAIKATGPSFELPAKKNGATLPIGFTNVASCITVNDNEAYMEDDELFIVSEESEVFARYASSSLSFFANIADSASQGDVHPTTQPPFHSQHHLVSDAPSTFSLGQDWYRSIRRH
jgi:hypothetical protein